MASSPITSWQIEGEKVELGTEFLFLGSTITANGNCSHEIRRWLLLSQKAMRNLGNVLKSRDITLTKLCRVKVMVFLTKVRIVKDMVFPVAMYGCESWTIKKAERQRTAVPSNCGAGEDPWEAQAARRSNQSVSGEINPEYSLEGLMLKHPVFWSPNSWLIAQVPDAGKDWGQKEKMTSEDEMAGWRHQCNGHELGQTSRDGEGQGGLACCSPWGRKESNVTGQLNTCTHDVYIYFMHPYCL